MSQKTVDLTGIQGGDTIKWDTTAGKFIVGPPLIASVAINYPVDDVSDLPDSPADGSKATVRVGTWPNSHQEVLRYHADVDKWIGEQEYPIVTQSDTWAMSLDNRTGAQRLDWSPVTSAVPYGKSFALLAGALDLDDADFESGDGVITVDTTTSPHSVAFQASSAANPYLQIRDNYLSYDAKTSDSFTGCTLIQGSGGTIPDTEFVTQGNVGGYGFNNTSLLFAGSLFGAGLTLQEKLVSLMNSAPGEKKLTIAPYWYEYDPGDGTVPITLPLTGGMGVTAGLESLPLTGGAQANGERDFYMTENEWSNWPLTNPTKQFLVPKIVGKMEAGATLSGTCLDTKLTVRWVV